MQIGRVAIQFAGGIDTKTDAKAVLPTKLIDLQNGVFLKNGTISKRNGYKILGRSIDGKTSPWKSAVALGKRGSELLVFADANAYSYRSGSDAFNLIGPVSSVVASGVPVARTGTDQIDPDAATSGGVTLVAWEDNGVNAAVLDATGRRVIIGATLVDASGKMPRCIAVGSVLMLLWVNSTNIWCKIVNPSAPTAFGTSAVLTNDLSAAKQYYDAIATFDAFDSVVVQAAANYDSTARPGLIAYATSTGIAVAYIHQSGVLGSITTSLPNPGAITASVGGPIAVDIWTTQVAAAVNGDPSIAVVYADGSGNLQYVGQDGFALGGGSPVQLSGLGVTWNRVTCAYGGLDASSQLPLWWAGEVNGATVDVNYVVSGKVISSTVTTNTDVRGHCLTTRAFYDNGDVYVGIVHAVKFFPYVAVVQISGSMKAQGRLLPGLSSGVLTRAILPSVFPLGLGASGSNTRQHAVCLGYRIQYSGTSGTQFGEQGIQLFTLDYDHADAYRNTELGKNMYLGGALIQSYDGARFAEHNFHCAPDTASGTITAVGALLGSLTTGQYYGVKYVYEEIDAQGEIHPGPVSIGTIVQLTGGNNAIVSTIPTCRLTSKNRVRIGVFRSLASATAPPDPEAIEYFRVSSVDPTAVGANGYVLNNSTVDTVTFIDRMADTTAATLEPLYTNGGVLSNDPEQSGGEAIVGGKNRLFWLDPLDGNLINYSQELRADTAAELSAFLSQRVDPYGGDIVALAVMDDNVIAFKERAIFAFGGPGPDSLGETTTRAFTPAQLVTNDVGCSSPGSISNVPDGIVFQSDKGPRLLGRDLRVKPIGDDVYAYWSEHVSSADILPGRPHIVFLTDADGGRTLMFDYERGQWGTFTNHVGVDSVVIDSVYYYLRADGNVFQETPGVYKDGTQHIPLVIETAWIKLSEALQGWQKIMKALVLGNYLSSHTLRLEYKLNYEPTWSKPIDRNVDGVYAPSNYGAGNYGAGVFGGAGNTTYQERFHISRRNQAIAFRIQAIEAYNVYGASCEISELLLTGGVEQVARRPFPQTRTS